MQTEADANPLNLDTTLVEPARYLTPQAYTDPAHVSAIADDMRAHGWQGAPLVVLPDYCISWTGTHRLAAARETGTPVPTIDAAELFAACGIDLWQLCANEEYDTDHDVPAILAHLPAHVLTRYALDDIC